MSDPLEVTASSLEALGDQYRAIAHNLANANTAGYKRLCSSFIQVLQQVQAGQSGGLDVEIPGGPVFDQITIDFSQGAMVRTGRPLDLALDGKGFFVLETPEGPLYARNGVFRTNPEGQLVDSSGRTVAGEGGPIVIPPTASTAAVRLSGDGSISVAGQSVGKLRLVQFAEETVLTPVGGNCFGAPDTAEASPATDTTVLQGFQEASNVRVVEELVGLITVSRHYEANIKAITVQDEQMKNILQVAMG